MATYAPLLAHKNGWQWRPDLIWFDNRTVVPSGSYYVQQLYAANRGSRVIPLTLDGKPAAGNRGQSGLFASAVYDDDSRCYIIKAVNTGDEDVTLTIRPRLKKKTALSGDVETVTLASDTPEADNTFENPTRIVPATSTLTLGADRNLTDTLPPLTFRLYRLPLAR